MKASDMPLETRVATVRMVGLGLGLGCKMSQIGQTGIIKSNSSRQGDEVVIVEWDGTFNVSVVNVNDLIKLGS